MILKHFGQLKRLAKKTFTGIKAKLTELVRVFVPEAISVVRRKKQILVAADGNVLDMGKRYRLTSGHAPLFSLFTFFKNSQLTSVRNPGLFIVIVVLQVTRRLANSNHPQDHEPRLHPDRRFRIEEAEHQLPEESPAEFLQSRERPKRRNEQ